MKSITERANTMSCEVICTGVEVDMVAVQVVVAPDVTHVDVEFMLKNDVASANAEDEATGSEP